MASERVELNLEESFDFRTIQARADCSVTKGQLLDQSRLCIKESLTWNRLAILKALS